MLNQKIVRRYPLNITIFTVLQNAWKAARKLLKEAKKTGANKHRLCQDEEDQIATGALMPGCGS